MKKTGLLLLSMFLMVSCQKQRITSPEKEPLEAFKATTGEYILYKGWLPEAYYSTDGKNFFHLYSTGYGGSNKEHDASYINPNNEEEWEWSRKGELITRDDGVQFRQISVPQKSKLHPFPETWGCNGFFDLQDGSFIYLERLVYIEELYPLKNNFRFFLGKMENMREVEIEKIESYCHGSTLHVYTREGFLYLPVFSCSGKDSPKWNDQDIVCLDHSDYNIERTGGDVLKLKAR